MFLDRYGTHESFYRLVDYRKVLRQTTENIVSLQQLAPSIGKI